MSPMTVVSLFMAISMVPLPAAADIRGIPTILDGDSLEIDGYRFDLFGIDSPEPGTMCRKDNGGSFDCGHVATTALMDLTAGLEVICTPLDETDLDKAETILATCSAGGFSLNRNMVHTGWALAKRSASDAYINTEHKAKTAKRGLWRSKVESPPWPSR